MLFLPVLFAFDFCGVGDKNMGLSPTLLKRCFLGLNPSSKVTFTGGWCFQAMQRKHQTLCGRKSRSDQNGQGKGFLLESASLAAWLVIPPLGWER